MRNSLTLCCIFASSYCFSDCAVPWLSVQHSLLFFSSFALANRARTAPTDRAAGHDLFRTRRMVHLRASPLLEYDACPAVLIYTENSQSEHIITAQVVNWIHVQKFVWFKKKKKRKKVMKPDRRQNMEKLLHQSIKPWLKKQNWSSVSVNLFEHNRTAHSESRNLAVNGVTAVWNCCGWITQHGRKSGSVNSGGKNTYGNDFI